MKKFIGSILCATVIISIALTAAGCFDNAAGSEKIFIDNGTDLIKVSGDSAENEEGGASGDLYTSKNLNFITEINGSYRTDRPFTVDKNDEHKRIYDDLYLYEYDFFQMMSSDYRYIWAGLGDPDDAEYAETEREQEEDVQVNIKKSGIYKVVFDTDTFLFDLEYKGEITTPVYEEIDGCEIYSTATEWVVMERSGDEFKTENFEIEAGKLVSFFSRFSHTSNYKTTIDESSANKYIRKTGKKPSSDVYFMLGGTYDIYINAKTYVVRVEPVSIGEYAAKVYENGGFADLTNLEQAPNIFTYKYTAVSDVGGYGVVSDDLPEIYGAGFLPFALTPTGDSMRYLGESRGRYYFKKAGTYSLTIDLFEFTVDVQKDPD